MNTILQAFLNQLILFAFTAAWHVYYCHKEGKTDINPFNSKAAWIMFIVIWFGLGTYFTWKFNYGVWM